MSRVHPGLPGATIRPTSKIYVDPRDGELYQGTNVTVTPEVFREYVEGYRCARCHAAQKEAFPERCIEGQYNACAVPGGFEMRKLQSEVIAKEFEGEDVLWPEFPEDEERLAWRPSEGSRIWVPGHSA